ncbi:Replication protein, DnaD/DnaB domain [Moorella glycerini]|uniref:DNA replication protein DnaD n=1 Tax=Neomoorella stamsii TaxID=1266720 RepID=A0A9X7J174_9FIRM|nr:MULTISPECIES: DnaD domain protein [Moorella]PRR71379.1 DNA replication protein DnaD [Moorella stamsii]CEP66625.1 Replication protein, DnaD/DnaB domain [Moorella glycerini]CEP68587.1 Replication protein, DnaD/DnaB domain [Moorella glycerini]
MASNDGYQALATAMLEAGSLVIPDLLVKFYARLGLTETEMMVLIHLLHWRQVEQERFPTPEKISQYMSLDSEEVKNLIASIIEKKLLAVEPYYHPSLGRWQNTFSFTPLWTKLIQLALGDYHTVTEVKKETAATAARQGELYRTFEKEFGRPLSPLESEQLKAWCQDDQMPVELLQEALRRAVLRGIVNFRYIDSILRDWQRHNIRTVAEAMAYDEKVKTKKTRSTRPASSSTRKDKYRDLYRLNPEG